MVSSWTQVAEVVGSRHAERKYIVILAFWNYIRRRLLRTIECAKRWQHSLDPNVENTKWEKHDDELLMSKAEVHSHSWKTIKQKFFPKRSTTDIKNR